METLVLQFTIKTVLYGEFMRVTMKSYPIDTILGDVYEKEQVVKRILHKVADHDHYYALKKSVISMEYLQYSNRLKELVF
jgi:hypothetical protein